MQILLFKKKNSYFFALLFFKFNYKFSLKNSGKTSFIPNSNFKIKLNLTISKHIFTHFNKNEKAAKYYSHIIGLWMAVDPLMLIHPNSLSDDEFMVQYFYLLQKQVLIENKEKKVFEKEAHSQTGTIKLKLISFTELL